MMSVPAGLQCLVSCFLEILYCFEFKASLLARIYLTYRPSGAGTVSEDILLDQFARCSHSSNIGGLVEMSRPKYVETRRRVTRLSQRAAGIATIYKKVITTVCKTATIDLKGHLCRSTERKRLMGISLFLT